MSYVIANSISVTLADVFVTKSCLQVDDGHTGHKSWKERNKTYKERAARVVSEAEDSESDCEAIPEVEEKSMQNVSIIQVEPPLPLSLRSSDIKPAFMAHL